MSESVVRSAAAVVHREGQDTSLYPVLGRQTEHDACPVAGQIDVRMLPQTPLCQAAQGGASRPDPGEAGGSQEAEG